MQFPKTFEIDGFKVTLYATETEMKISARYITMQLHSENIHRGIYAAIDLAKEILPDITDDMVKKILLNKSRLVGDTENGINYEEYEADFITERG